VFKPLFEFVRHALFLQRDVSELKKDVASLERGLHETNEVVRQLAHELQRAVERERNEREEFLLKLENALLRQQRALPTARKTKKRK
jgi:hypothetical protein